MAAATVEQQPGGTSTRTVDRALRLLAAVTDAGDDATLSELARRTGLSPSTAARLLRTLELHGFVRRGDDARYRPGQRLLHVAARALSEDRLYEAAGPALAELARETQETASLAVAIDGDRALYLRQFASPQLVRTASWTGRTIPVRTTATGAALRDRVGAAGYAVRRAAVESDVTAVAAPVTGPGGGVVAALTVLAPSYRTSDAGAEAIGEAVVRHAGALSEAIGGRGRERAS
jgi:DNA-binding IclR family transcriptional regulator